MMLDRDRSCEEGSKQPEARRRVPVAPFRLYWRALLRCRRVDHEVRRGYRVERERERVIYFSENRENRENRESLWATKGLRPAAVRRAAATRARPWGSVLHRPNHRRDIGFW